MPSSPRRTAHSHANRTLPSEKPLTASPAQLTHPSSPSSAPSSVHSVPFSLHSSHLRRRADGPTSDRPADLFAASDYAHHAAGVALFGPAPRSPLVGQELERARLRDKYALRPEQEEVLGRMMRGVWERLGGGPLEGSATAAGPRPRDAQPRAPPPEMPDPPKDASPTREPISLPDSPPSTRTSVHGGAPDLWADERGDPRASRRDRTPYASATPTPLSSPPILATPLESPRSTYRSRPASPSPLPSRAPSLSPPASPPPPRVADRTLTPMPSPPTLPPPGPDGAPSVSFPHLPRTHPPLFRSLAHSFLPSRSGLRTTRAPLVDASDLSAEERVWVERTRRVVDDGGLRDWWGYAVGLGGDWGRGVLSPIVTETEPTHSSPALSFRSGASFLTHRSVDSAAAHAHRGGLSVPPASLGASPRCVVGADEPATARGERGARAQLRSPRMPLTNGVAVSPSNVDPDATIRAASTAALDLHDDDLSSFVARGSRARSEPFFGGASSTAPSRSHRDRATTSLRSVSSSHAVTPMASSMSPSGDGASVLPAGVEYDPSLTPADYAHASPNGAVHALDDDSFFLGGGSESLGAVSSSRRTGAGSRASRTLDAGERFAGAPTEQTTEGGGASDRSRTDSMRSPRSTIVGPTAAASRDSSFRASASSSSAGRLPSTQMSYSEGPELVSLGDSRAEPSVSSLRASRSRGAGPLFSHDSVPGAAASFPSRMAPPNRDHGSVVTHGLSSPSRDSLRSPSRADHMLDPRVQSRDYALDSPSMRTTSYSTALASMGEWASPSRSPSGRGERLPTLRESGMRDSPRSPSSVSTGGAGVPGGWRPERAARSSTSRLDNSTTSPTTRSRETGAAGPAISARSSRDDISRWASGVPVGASGETTTDLSQSSSTERAASRTNGSSSRTDLAAPVDAQPSSLASTLSPSRASHRSSSRSPTKSSQPLTPRSASRVSSAPSPGTSAPTPSEYVSARDYLPSRLDEGATTPSRRGTLETTTLGSSQRSPPPVSSPFFGASSASRGEEFSPGRVGRAGPVSSRSYLESEVRSPESSLFGVGSPASTPPPRRAVASFSPRLDEATEPSFDGRLVEPRAPLPVPRSVHAASGPDMHGTGGQLSLGSLSSTPRSPPLVPTGEVPVPSELGRDDPSLAFSKRYPPPSPHQPDWDGATAAEAVGYSPAGDDSQHQGYGGPDLVSPRGPAPSPPHSPVSSPSRSVYSSSAAPASTNRYVARPPVKPPRRGPGPFPVPQLSEEEKRARRELRRTGRSPEWDLPISETKSAKRMAAWGEMQAFEKERARLFKLLGDPLSEQDVPVLNALAVLYLDSSNPAVRQQAMQFLQNSLQLNESQPDMARLLALELEEVDLEEALAWHRFAVERGPDNPERHLSLGHCLLRAGDPVEASHVFVTVAQSFTDEPYEAIALYELGRLYQQHGAEGTSARANALEAFEGALACLARLRLERPETRLGERWDELDLVEKAVLRGLQEVRHGQKSARESPFASRSATPRGPLSPVVSTKAPPSPRGPVVDRIPLTPKSPLPQTDETLTSNSVLARDGSHSVSSEAPGQARSSAQLSEVLPAEKPRRAFAAEKPVRPPRRQRRKVDPETARTLDTILSFLSRLSRATPAAQLADSTRSLSHQVERTYAGLRQTSGGDAAQQAELVRSLDEVRHALGALPDKLASSAKLVAARPPGVQPPRGPVHDALEEARRKLERAKGLVM